jgi:hypothetical protein
VRVQLSSVWLCCCAAAGLAHALLPNCTHVQHANVPSDHPCRFGRRFLLIEGGIQLTVCQLVVGILIATSLGSSGGWWVVGGVVWCAVVWCGAGASDCLPVRAA